MSEARDAAAQIVVMSPNYWGSGETLQEAKRNLRKQGGSQADTKLLILTFGEDSEFLGVDEFGRYHYKGEPPTVQEVNT